MKQKTKQLIMTLVALLALTTGARVQWTGGTYTATGNENLNTINVSDDATLTINQGVIVTVTGGIVVADGKTLTITGGGTLLANGANRGKGDDGGEGANGQTGIPGGTAIAGNVIINGVGLTVTAYGGQGGDGGNGGNGGNGGYAFAGTLTVFGGNVSAYGGNGGELGYDSNYGHGGEGDHNGELGSDGRSGDYGRDGAVGNAYANSVTFEAATYTVKDNSGNPIDINNITSKREVIIESADVEPAPTATPVPLTWDATAKTATLTNGMPAGNVTVSVEYFPQAEFAMSTGETPVALAPTAIDGVPANTDDPIVTAGTVANIGTSVDKQGTLMYFVSQSTGNTVPEAPDYDTKGWSEDVPTANGLAEGKAFVWYYIKGAEPAQGTDRTDDNTRSDSDIMPLGTNGIVTLAAEPTYDVTLNDEGLSTDEAAAWKVAKGTDDPAAFPLKGVKKGTEVTGTNWTQLVLSSQDAPIDTDKQYKWVQEEIGSGGVGGGGVSGGEPLF